MALGKTLGIFAGGSLLGGLMSKAQKGDEEAVAATHEMLSLRTYLDSGYRSDLGYKEDEIPTLVKKEFLNMAAAWIKRKVEE